MPIFFHANVFSRVYIYTYTYGQGSGATEKYRGYLTQRLVRVLLYGGSSFILPNELF